MKKNNILTVFRVFVTLVAWFLIYKCYGLFIDPLLEGYVSDSIRAILSRMVIPYTLGFGTAYLIVRGMPKGNDSGKLRLNVTPILFIKAFLIQMGLSMPVIMIGNMILKILERPLGGMSREEIFGEHAIFYIVLLLVFNPIMEEVLFRKLALDRLLVLGEVPAIFISAAFFGLPHAYSQGVPQMFGTFVLGLVWAYVRINTGKIWPSMILHMLFNLYGAYFTLFMAGTNITACILAGLNMLILPIPAVILFILTMSHPSTSSSNNSEVTLKSL